MALEDSTYTGVINAVAPEPVRMVDFANALGAALRRPSLFPVPGPVLQLLLGDGAKVVLEGQQVVSERLSDLGFEFEFGDIKAALAAATSPESR
jgi:NAD dependent epimerase/dehydratase family enzyme